MMLLLCALLAAFHPVVVGAQTIDGHPCFRTLNSMTQDMFALATNHPDLVSIQDIGDSYLKSTGSSNSDYGLNGGYDIYAMNITSVSSQQQSSSKGKAFFISGVHPREYAPPELLMRFAEMLVDGYDVDADITSLLHHTEVHLIIYVNPDGRYVAENYPDDRWRKNLNPRGGCSEDDEIGVDLNRNYDFMWGDTDGASDDPCSNNFYGSSAESEPETQAVVNYAKALFPESQRKSDPEGDRNVAFGDDVTGIFSDVHASGGYVIFPWTYAEDERSPDDDALQALGHKLSYYNGYDLWAPGSEDFEYQTTGESTDYIYGALGVASFSLELGEEFYEDCDLFENEIVPINMPALLHAANIAKKPFSLIKGPDILDLDAVDGTAGDDVKVIVVASDSKLAPDLTTSSQSVAGVRLYLNVHPDDYQDGDMAWDMVSVNDNSDAHEFELGVTFPAGVMSGRHTFYAQSVDSSGYKGPVSSRFVEVVQTTTTPPSNGPTPSPSPAPTNEPTPAPSPAPSNAPTTAEPTPEPSNSPTARPSLEPTHKPTTSPSLVPSSSPTTMEPSMNPTTSPIASPTYAPSKSPTEAPSNQPTTSPTFQPTSSPTVAPSSRPTSAPSTSPSKSPTEQPSASPTEVPTTSSPSTQPTANPTKQPTEAPAEPTFRPWTQNTWIPTSDPAVADATTPVTNPLVSAFAETKSEAVPSSSGSPYLSAAVAIVSALSLLCV